MPDLATLQTRLTEAEAVYHRLMTGSLEEHIWLGDMRVQYAPADSPKLAVYISQMRGEIAALGGTDTGTRRRALVVDL